MPANKKGVPLKKENSGTYKNASSPLDFIDFRFIEGADDGNAFLLNLRLVEGGDVIWRTSVLDADIPNLPDGRYMFPLENVEADKLVISGSAYIRAIDSKSLQIEIKAPPAYRAVSIYKKL